MIQRALPVRVRPEPGESFHSLMVRLAARNEAPLHTVMAATGFIDYAHFKTLPRAYGVVAELQRIINFAVATRILVSDVQRTMLIAYDGICLDLDDLQPQGGTTLRAAALREWMYAAGSHLCPACLHEDGYWQLKWKLPWSFACTRHRVLLASHCEGCSRRIQSGRQDGSTIPVLPSVVPDIRICHNPLPSGIGISGRKEVCGIDLTATQSEDVSQFPSLLAAQERIDQRLAGPANAEHLDFFARMRSVCAVLLASGERSQLGPLPSAAENAWEQHVQERDTISEQRAAARLKNMDGRKGPRQRVWTGAHVQSSLLAAVIPTAAAVVAEPSRLADLARVARGTRPRHAPYLASWFRMPADLRDIWDRAIEQTAPRLSDQLARLAPASSPADVRGIPQLWPEELYERDVAPLVEGVSLSPITMRAYMSLVAARQTEGGTWHEAALALGYGGWEDGRGVARLVNNVATKLGVADRRERFIAAVPAILAALDDLASVDYRLRERRFAHWDGLHAGRLVRHCSAGRDQARTNP